MTAQRLTHDRPLLKVFAPTAPDNERGWTIQAAFDAYVGPQLGKVAKSTRDDCHRYLRYWDQFELQLVEPAQTAQPPEPIAGEPSRTRMGYPCARDGGQARPILSELNTHIITAFRDWICSADGLNLGPSTANKAYQLIVRIIAAAGDDCIAVPSIHTKPLSVPAAPKCYLLNTEVDRLWDAAERQLWPAIEPATFWRSILIFMRTYGMRVQDLVAYTSTKQPLTWANISYHPQTPDPQGHAEWHLGWMHYTASKTGRKYYLPLTAPCRSAIDRLRQIAAQSLNCDPRDIPSVRPILPCPFGRAINDHWKLLQAAAGVRNKLGKMYILEDFRKTAATFLEEHRENLPHYVCGWSIAKSAVADKHYIHAERTIVKYLPTAPVPESFSRWVDSDHSQQA